MKNVDLVSSVCEQFRAVTLHVLLLHTGLLKVLLQESLDGMFQLQERVPVPTNDAQDLGIPCSLLNMCEDLSDGVHVR